MHLQDTPVESKQEATVPDLKKKRRRVSVSSPEKRIVVRASSDAKVEQLSTQEARPRVVTSKPQVSERFPLERNREFARDRRRPYPSSNEFRKELSVYPYEKISTKEYPYAKEEKPARSFKPKKNGPSQPFKEKKGIIKKRNIPEPVQPIKFDSPFKDSTEPFRLNRFLSNAGVCSRREADKHIEAGRVKVNGQVVTELGTRVLPQDEIYLNDEKVTLESKVYILLNKPKNCVTTMDDPQNRKTVMDIVKRACTERIYPVGRLDRNTTGVLLITNDGDLAARLMHPEYEKKKIYHVWLDKPVEIEHMQQIATGLMLDDGEIHADAISYVQEDDYSQVGIEIHSGRNRIVRRIFEHLGYKVIKLDRVYFAGLTKKDLPRGKWRYLTEEEVRYLRMGAFAKRPETSNK